MTALNLVSLPVEILSFIISLLDIVDILNFRKTCSLANAVTTDRAIWLPFLQEFNRYLPLTEIHSDQSDFSALSTSEIETLVQDTFATQVAWNKPRTAPPIVLHPAPANGRIVTLEVILDRWVAAITDAAILTLWDTHDIDSGNQEVKSCYRCFDLGKGTGIRSSLWNSNLTHIDAVHGTLIVVINGLRQVEYQVEKTATFVYEVALVPTGHDESTDPSNSGLKMIDVIEIPDWLTIKQFDPDHGLALYLRNSHGICELKIISWLPKGYIKATTMSVHSEEDPDHAWRHIAIMRFAGPYVIVAKYHTLEVHPIPQYSSILPHLPILKEALVFTNLRDIQITDIVYNVFYAMDCDDSHQPYPTLQISFSLLGYDLLQGLFRYDARVSVPGLSSPYPSVVEVTQSFSSTESYPPINLPPPFLELTLVGVYPMAHSVRVLSQPIQTSTPTPILSDASHHTDAHPVHPAMQTITPQSPSAASSSASMSGSDPVPASISVVSTPTHTPLCTSQMHSDTPAGTPVAHVSTSRAAHTAASRGYVSAYRLGAQGRRAVWVERSRASTMREFIVWGLDPPSDSDCERQDSGSGRRAGDGLGLPRSHRRPTIEMERRVVWSNGSYDLRGEALF
ncbi:hypothetical protein HGRIS_004856 [Hohenbuehelia grisea]|uniref:F-box domain-containing protein n=1 Tax=Hohenbuehelia grisea TaxID=104357 RepID=A0ABR3JD91_9AGAR